MGFVSLVPTRLLVSTSRAALPQALFPLREPPAAVRPPTVAGPVHAFSTPGAHRAPRTAYRRLHAHASLGPLLALRPRATRCPTPVPTALPPPRPPAAAVPQPPPTAPSRTPGSSASDQPPPPHA